LWAFASAPMSMMARDGRAVERFLQRVDLPTPGVPDMAMLGRVRVGMACGWVKYAQSTKIKDFYDKSCVRKKISFRASVGFDQVLFHNLVFVISYK